MRGADELTLVQLSPHSYDSATDDRHAADLIQAHLLETLSSIGREWIDIYFLRVRKNMGEAQISGALEAMEMARQEGHIRHLGLLSDGPALATLGLWQFHDAFEAIMVPRNPVIADQYQTLSPLAQERRVGIVSCKPLNWGYGLPVTDLASDEEKKPFATAVIASLCKEHPVLVSVRSPEEVEVALNAANVEPPESLTAIIEPYLATYSDENFWQELLSSSVQHKREAADRWAAAQR